MDTKQTTAKRSPLESKPLHNPGQSLDREIHRLVDEKVVPYLAVGVMACFLAMNEWWRAYVGSPPQPIAMTIVASVFAGYGAYIFIRHRRSIRSLRLGLEGEKFVGQRLEDLRRQGCQVFHDLVADGFNIDHVVVAPQGVFVIETKTRNKPAHGPVVIDFNGDRVRVNGLKPDRDPVAQVRASARWLSDHLFESTTRRFPVKGVIVFPGWFIKARVRKKSDVWVLNEKSIRGFLRREPIRLQPEDVALVSARIVVHMQTVD
jgi:hypothetical protein